MNIDSKTRHFHSIFPKFRTPPRFVISCKSKSIGMVNLKMMFVKLIVVVLVISLFGCKEDVAGSSQNDSLDLSDFGVSTSKRIDGDDVPHIIDFISDQTNGTMSYQLKVNSGSREADLTYGEVITEDIIELTNQDGLSNYTFQLEKSEADGEDSWLNLVIKETSSDLYGYILKYRPESSWLSNQDTVISWITFTGDIVLYNSGGSWIATHTFSNGANISRVVGDPCPNCTAPDGTPCQFGCDPVTNQCNPDPNNGGGNNNTGGDPSGCSGNCGPDPTQIDITFNCFDCFHEDHQQFHPPCLHPICVVEVITRVTENGNTRDLLRNPCLDCPSVNDCEHGWDSDCNCIDENGDIGMNLPSNPCEWLDERMNQQDFADNINILNGASNVAPPTDRFEKSFTISGYGINSQYTPFVGSPNVPEIPNASIPPGSSGYIHNHFFINESINGIPYKSLSIFSSGDFIALYKTAKLGGVDNAANFTYLQVYQGHMFQLQITNLQALIDFGDSWLQPNADGTDSKLIHDEMIRPSLSNVRHENGILVNRDNMARMLKKFKDAGLDMGLELYYSPVANPDWKKVQVNNDNSVTLEDCL